jgi:hypothetical protein
VLGRHGLSDLLVSGGLSAGLLHVTMLAADSSPDHYCPEVARLHLTLIEAEE